jgi:hypothetical protein
MRRLILESEEYRMTNLEKYNKVFRGMFRKTDEELPGLKYRGIPLWDSIGHMDLVGELEEVFDIRIETQDVLAITSYEKGKEVLGKYGVEIE